MTQKIPLRVRINLRLAETWKAENIMRVNRYDRQGRLISSPSTAYATDIVLCNVVPVINEGLRARIARGERFKTSCAWLEGDLVAWSGRFRDKADQGLRAALKVSKCADAFNRAVACDVLSAGEKVGFNPKKFKVFYDLKSKDVLERAATVAVCHWAYGVAGGVFRPMTDEDVEKDGIAPSAYEISDLPKGLQTTRKRLERLAIDL